MKFLIDGVNDKNKGAELMMYATLDQIDANYPNSHVVIRGGINHQFKKYKTLSVIYPICENKFLRRIKFIRILEKLHLPSQWCSQMSYVRGADVIFDASGFRFSDQWNMSKLRTQYFLNFFEYVAKHNQKLVFLPQAWGPIEQPNTQKLIEAISRDALLIYAREQVSYNIMINSGVNMKKLRIGHDFTCLVPPHIPNEYDHLRNAVCIIPNERMLDMTSTNERDYVVFYRQIYDICQHHKRKVYILNHAGISDRKICNILQSELGVECVDNLSAIEIKGLLSTAYVVVSSRFHGMANALNASVPCLATAWSHKYEQLLSDYNQHDCILSMSDRQFNEVKLHDFLSEEINQSIRKELTQVNSRLRSDVIKMWQEIWTSVKSIA